MGRYKDFDAARAEHAQKPIGFKVGGEEFTVDAALPAGILMDLGQAMVLGDDTKAFGAFVHLWEAIIPEADTERFAQALRRVDFATMFDLVGWIVEEATGRPKASGRFSWTAPPPNGASSSSPPGSSPEEVLSP